MNTGLFEGYTTHPVHHHYGSLQNTLTVIMLKSHLTALIMTSCFNVKPLKRNHVLHLITLQCILVRLSHKEPNNCTNMFGQETRMPFSQLKNTWTVHQKSSILSLFKVITLKLSQTHRTFFLEWNTVEDRDCQAS